MPAGHGRCTNPNCCRVLVVVNPSDSELESLRPEQGHQLLQLHGEETPERCQQLRDELGLPLWKALRIRSAADLQQAQAYSAVVDGLLLDAWSDSAHGGTGERLPLQWLQGFQPLLPWWLAGGLGPAAGHDVRHHAWRGPVRRDAVCFHHARQLNGRRSGRVPSRACGRSGFSLTGVVCE